ncbi:MAG: response regulator transcription factor [Chitinophagaceae bacterium]
MITIGIIEDDPNLRNNLEAFIDTQKDTLLAFSLNSIEQFLERKSSYEEPFIVFCDLGLPGISGKEGITFIRQLWHEVYVVVITGTEDEETIYDCIERGANGYVVKPFKIQELINQIDIIRNGGALLSPQVALKLFKQIQKQTVALQTGGYGFTPREKQVVDELLKGLSYKEIASVLGISSTTVNDHLKNVYRKMGVRTKSELMRRILKT